MEQISNRGKLLHPHELAAVLGVSLSWVYIHVAPKAKKRIPFIKVGGLLRFEEAEVLNWLKEQETSHV